MTASSSSIVPADAQGSSRSESRSPPWACAAPTPTRRSSTTTCACRSSTRSPGAPTCKDADSSRSWPSRTSSRRPAMSTAPVKRHRDPPRFLQGPHRGRQADARALRVRAHHRRHHPHVDDVSSLVHAGLLHGDHPEKYGTARGRSSCIGGRIGRSGLPDGGAPHLQTVDGPDGIRTARRTSTTWRSTCAMSSRPSSGSAGRYRTQMDVVLDYYDYEWAGPKWEPTPPR